MQEVAAQYLGKMDDLKIYNQLGRGKARNYNG
jgi:hypothetical protein